MGCQPYCNPRRGRHRRVSLEDNERSLLGDALEKTNRNQAQAARLASDARYSAVRDEEPLHESAFPSPAPLPASLEGKHKLGQSRHAHHCSGPTGSIEANLGHIHIFGLQALRPLLYFKGYASTLVKRAISASRNGGKMDEHVFATFALDKSKSFCGVKPLYCSGFFQDDSFCDLTP
jgi:hypothetical protein